MKDDLVERLRDYAANGYRSWFGIDKTFTEAADRIEALERQLEAKWEATRNG